MIDQKDDPRNGAEARTELHVQGMKSFQQTSKQHEQQKTLPHHDAPKACKAIYKLNLIHHSELEISKWSKEMSDVTWSLGSRPGGQDKSSIGCLLQQQPQWHCPWSRPWQSPAPDKWRPTSWALDVPPKMWSLNEIITSLPGPKRKKTCQNVSTYILDPAFSESLKLLRVRNMPARWIGASIH